MAFKTEVSFFRSKPLKDKFTDREEPQKLFWDKYNSLDISKNEHDVIHYYGVGGIGKTALLKKLRDDLIESGNDNVVLYSFENNSSKEQFLFALARQISIHFNAPLPVFGYAYIRLLKNLGMSDDEIELRLKNNNTGILVTNSESSIKTENTFSKATKLLLSVGTDFVPILGNTLERVGESLIDLFTDRIAGNRIHSSDEAIDGIGKELIIEIDDAQTDNNDIIKNLHAYLAYDCRNILIKAEKPIVIIWMALNI